MGKSIVICEKPSVAQEFARALRVKSEERNNGYIENDKWIVTWTVGHLITMSYPEKYDKALKEWSLNTLPFLPEQFKYEPIPAVSKQFNIVKKLYNRSDIDSIYYAGDSGREGLYIQMLVRQEAGHNKNAKEAVVWLDSPTEEEILKGISEAKDISYYEHMKDAGYMRAIEDYLVGINFSRLLTVKYASMLNSGSGQKKHKPISIGRVMTCVLGMIVNREREIKDFKPQNFYRIGAKIHLDNIEDIECEWRDSEESIYHNTPKLYKNYGLINELDANELISGFSSQLKIISIKRNIIKKKAPLLFNLAELQSECAKKLHISPNNTLAIAQSLYEKKLTTYPRTDARVLSSAVAKEIDKNLSRLKKGQYSNIVELIETNRWSIDGKYIDDSKITDHYAIIPTGISPDSKLSNDEQVVYDMICRRFLAIFYPASETENIIFEAKNGVEHFEGSSKYISFNGFYDVLGLPDNIVSDEGLVEAISKLKEGFEYDSEYFIKKGKTEAPKRYSTGSMILAMENAGTLIEDEELREQIIGCGIGTSATRAEVIDKLIKLNYIMSNNKTQILKPTNFGEMIYEVVDSTVPQMLEPKITAEWEKELDDIAKGELSTDKFIEQLYDFISKYCNDIKNIDNNDDVYKRIRPFATDIIRSEYKKFDNWDTKLICPLCGKEIETTSWGFKCKGNISKSEGCNFSIGNIMGHRLLTPELKQLLTNGKIGPFYDFISTKGKPFGAILLWNNDTKKIDFDFVDLPWKKTEYKCPVCGKDVLCQENSYKCVDFIDFNNGCNFYIGKICGKSIPEKQIQRICSHNRTDLIKGFKNKEGKVFDAFLEWSDSKKNINFIFPTNDDIKTKYKCPICGGSIITIHDGFCCENYKPVNKRDKVDCCFYLGKIAGYTIKEKDLEAIVKGNTTELINNFKSKDKKPFSARLKWDFEKQSVVFMFNEYKDSDINLSCPICGNKIIKNHYGYFCSENKGKDNGGCSFGFTSYLGVKLDDAQFSKLINNKRTDLLEGFKSKNKNKFAAYLLLNDDGSFSLDFPDYKVNKSDYMCPVCLKNKLTRTDYSLKCDCGFKLSTTICEKKIEDDDLKKLFLRGETDVISGFYSAKKRNYFSAKLKIVDNEVKFEFPKKAVKEV